MKSSSSSSSKSLDRAWRSGLAEGVGAVFFTDGAGGMKSSSSSKSSDGLALGCSLTGLGAAGLAEGVAVFFTAGGMKSSSSSKWQVEVMEPVA